MGSEKGKKSVTYYLNDDPLPMLKCTCREWLRYIRHIWVRKENGNRPRSMASLHARKSFEFQVPEIVTDVVTVVVSFTYVVTISF